MKVLVGLDGSSYLEPIVDALTSRLWPANTAVKLVCVLEGLGDGAEAHAELVALAEKLQPQLPGVAIEIDLRRGHAKEVLLELSAEWAANLIIVGSHGRRGFELMLMGSVSQALINHALCPVLVAKPSTRYGAQGKNVLLPIDHSQFSEHTVDWVSYQCWNVPVHIRLVTAMPAMDGSFSAERDPERAAAMLSDAQAARGEVLQMMQAHATKLARIPNATVTCDLLDGDPRRAIVAAAKEWPADLIIMGSHGKSGLSRYLLGSVSSAVSQHTDCSIEIVRHVELKDFIRIWQEKDRQTTRSGDLWEYHPRANIY